MHKITKKEEKLMSEFLAVVAPKLRPGIALKLRYCLSYLGIGHFCQFFCIGLPNALDTLKPIIDIMDSLSLGSVQIPLNSMYLYTKTRYQL